MRKKFKFLIIVFILSLILISNIAFANYKSTISGNASAILKVPVFTWRNPDIIQGQMSSIKFNQYESTFNILNYFEKDELEENETVSEIDFEYTIKIIPSTFNFPVKYKLIDLQNNQELVLDSNLETEKLELAANKQNCNYKLIVEWDLENSSQNLDSNLDVEILVEGVQKQ